jgi:hypothetical protein
MVALNPHAVSGNHHFHAGITGDDFVQQALPVRTQMGHDDQRQADLRRQAAQKPFERFDAAGGSADADDGEILGAAHKGGCGGYTFGAEFLSISAFRGRRLRLPIRWRPAPVNNGRPPQ